MSRAIWVVVEHWKGQVSPVTRELIGRARELANGAGGGVTALVLAAESDVLAGELGGLGVDAACCVSSPELRQYRTRPYVEAAAAVIGKSSPMVVLVGATTNGREFAASLAAALDTGIAPDATEVEFAGEQIVARRPVYGGRLLEVVTSTGDGPWIVSVRPRA